MIVLLIVLAIPVQLNAEFFEWILGNFEQNAVTFADEKYFVGWRKIVDV